VVDPTVRSELSPTLLGAPSVPLGPGDTGPRLVADD